MSALSYNIHGERFEPPASMIFWRVRRLKPGGRGTPEVVFSPEGLPLLVSREADIEEFRRLVRNAPGRYRLDPVTEDQLACEDGSPAYLHIEEHVAVEAAPVVTAPHDDLLRTVVAANTEMVRCMSEKFAGVMEAAATLLRAADGAGMPQRDVRNTVIDAAPAAEPTIIEVERDETDGELAAILKSAVDTVMPLVGHTINTKVLGLSSEQSMALLGAAQPVQTQTQPALPEVETAFDDDADTQTQIVAAPPAPNEAPPRDFATHLREVEGLLAAKEIAMVRTAVTQMSPQTLLAWRDRLLSLDPAGAAALIRGEIYKGDLK